MKYLILAGLLLSASSVIAQDRDQKAYCSYTVEQAEAQAVFLRNPNVVAGLTQPNTGTSPQMYSGLFQSVTDWRKASLIRSAALKDCALHAGTDDVNLKIQSALPELQKIELAHRVVQLDAAISRLNTMIDRMKSIVDAQTATLPQLYVLQTARAKLELDRSNTELQIAQIQLPEISNVSISTLLSRKWAGELAKQAADTKLAAIDSWNLTLEGGLHQQIHPFIAGKPGFYGTVIFQYNIGSKKRNLHLAAASRDFQVWKYEQKDDAVQQSVLLRTMLTTSLTANRKQLQDLQATYNLIEQKLSVTDQVDSKESLIFSTQLTIDQISTKVEIGNTEFRIAQLQQYLQDNF